MLTTVRRVCLQFFVTIFITLQLAPLLPDAVRALTASSSAWAGTDTHVEQIAGTSSAYRMDTTMDYNRDCVPRQVATTTLALFSGTTLNSSCAVETPYGTYTRSGYLQRPGTEVYGQVRRGSTYGVEANIVPIPHSPVLMLSSGLSNYGAYYQLYGSGAGAITSTNLPDGSVRHVLNGTGTVLTDSSGTPVDLRYETMAFSSNGNWMIADSPSVGMVRVSLTGNQYTILPFGSKYPYSSAAVASRYTAISNDGRYALVAVADKVNVFDLDTCDTPPLRLIGPVACQSMNLVPTIKQSAPGFTGASMVRFVNENTVTLYVSQTGDTPGQPKHYMLYTGTKPVSNMTYLAMGDSFASGEGAYNYTSVTDANGNYCHVSQLSYPYLIANQSDFSASESIACSGAITDNITKQPENSKKKFQQAQGMESSAFDEIIYDGYLPGYRPQVEFVNRNKPQIITLSVGGNDIGFTDIIKRCVLSTDTCYGFYEDRLELLASINQKFDALVNTYNQIKSASPTSKMYIIGYPSIVAENGNCAANVLLNNDEIVFANQLTNYLNDTIRRATENAGVRYVDVSTALYGHRMCEAPSAEVAVNGLTAGNDTWRLLGGPVGNESYHPNARGHELLATAIRQKTTDFTQAMPAPNSAMFPATITADTAMLQVPKQNRVMTPIYYVPFAGQYLAKNAEQAFRLTTVTPLDTSSAEIWLNSTPVKIGTVTPKSDGTIDASVAIPDNIEPGYHTVHIYGKNIVGQKVDVQSTVYIAAHVDDLNGDGVPNTEDACPGFTAAHADEDHDGIDDGCDGSIVKTDTTAPVVTGDTTTSPNNNGWYNHDVTINWHSQDSGSTGITQLAPPAATVADTEGEKTYTSVPSCDAAGNCASGSKVVALDKSAPAVTYTFDTQPNSSGWFSTAPTVSFDCQDSISGIDTCPSPKTITTEGVHVFSETATDKAGNQTSVELRVALDTTKPIMTTRISQDPNELGWYKDTVVISYKCSDDISGIALCPDSQTIDQGTADRPVTATAADNAGNIQSSSHVMHIDTTRPTITFALSNPPNDRGWHNTPVTIDFNCSDELSGVEFCSPPQTIDHDGGYIIAGTARDRAGNMAEVNVFVLLDTHAPQIVTLVNPAANEYGWHNDIVHIHSECHDETSGMLACGEGQDVIIDQAGQNQSITLNAIDQAGNSTSATTTLHTDFTAPELGQPEWSISPKPINGTTQLTVQINDDLSGVQTVEYYIGDTDPGFGNGSPMTVLDNQATATFDSSFPLGVYAIHVRAKDKAGNWTDEMVTDLTVFEPTSIGITGGKNFTLSTKNASGMPWITGTMSVDARFAFSIKRTSAGDISRNSDFRMSYTTGKHCETRHRQSDCHSFSMDATSVTQFYVSGPQREIAIFQGKALLQIDGRAQYVTFQVTAGDEGIGAGKSADDTIALRIYRANGTPDSTAPLYEVRTTKLHDGAIKLREKITRSALGNS